MREERQVMHSELSEKSEVKVRVHIGFVLFPFLFAVVIDVVIGRCDKCVAVC